MGTAGTVVWIMGFLVSLLSPVLFSVFERTFGSSGGVFYLFTLMSLLSYWVGWKLMPETRHKTLEHISGLWLSQGDRA